jgi:rod shape-determining protein MreC
MRRRWQGSRPVLLFLVLLVCTGLITLSVSGLLTPVEGIAATPLNWISGIFNQIGLTVSGSVTELRDLEDLRTRNGELESELARLQSEVVSLREIGNDYTRLSALLNYVTTRDDLEYIAADVINRDTSRSLRTIIINKGTRDGIREGMAVITENGLVGRIINVSSTFSRVMLITSDDSFISARLSTSREEGSIHGQSATSLRMEMLPLNASVVQGDLVLTSGLGGNLPPDLVIGQVESTRRFKSEAEQTAEVRSLIDFNRLEIVLVITSFEPVDLSIFETDNTDTGSAVGSGN